MKKYIGCWIGYAFCDIYIMYPYWVYEIPPVFQIQTLLIRLRSRLSLWNGYGSCFSIWSGSLLFQKCNMLKTILFIHPNLVFHHSRTSRTQPECILHTLLNFTFQKIFAVLIRLAYGSVSILETCEWIQIQENENGPGSITLNTCTTQVPTNTCTIHTTSQQL